MCRCYGAYEFPLATPDDFTKGQPDVASIDVSFISLKLILPPLKPILKEGGDVLVLIKPQFEAGRERIGKKRNCQRSKST